MKLKNHDQLSQTVPDAMHTIKVVMEHLFNLIIGKEDSLKVRQAEINCNNLVSQQRPWRLSASKGKMSRDQLLFVLQRNKSRWQTNVHVL